MESRAAPLDAPLSSAERVGHPRRHTLSSSLLGASSSYTSALEYSLDSLLDLSSILGARPSAFLRQNQHQHQHQHGHGQQRDFNTERLRPARDEAARDGAHFGRGPARASARFLQLREAFLGGEGAPPGEGGAASGGDSPSSTPTAGGPGALPARADSSTLDRSGQEAEGDSSARLGHTRSESAQAAPDWSFLLQGSPSVGFAPRGETPQSAFAQIMATLDSTGPFPRAYSAVSGADGVEAQRGGFPRDEAHVVDLRGHQGHAREPGHAMGAPAGQQRAGAGAGEEGTQGTFHHPHPHPHQRQRQHQHHHQYRHRQQDEHQQQQQQQEQQEQQQQRPQPRFDLSHASRWMEHGVPFCVLLALVFVREHIAGCATFLWLTAVLVRCDDFIRRQAALKDQRSALQLAAAALLLVGHAVAMLWLFDGRQLLTALALHPAPQSPSFLQALFIVFVNDNLVRYLGMALKCLLLCSPASSLPKRSRRQGQVLSLVEYSLLLFRALVPTPVWFRYFLNERLGHLFPALITGLYLTFKLTSVLDRLILFLTSLKQVVRHEVHYGSLSTKEEIAKAGDMCAICHDQMSSPITLRCTHVFCEDCVAEWFEREQTCPMCRTVIKAPSLKSFADASTTLTVQIF